MQNNKRNIKRSLIWVLTPAVLFMAVLYSCEPWSETADVSHISILPEFEIIGGEYNTFVVADSADYTDPGARAYSDGIELTVTAYGYVDLTEVGVYTVTYEARNSYGLKNTSERIISVTYSDVSDRDLTGQYEGTLWAPLTEMKVEKIGADGFYECSEILGYPGVEMKGVFADLGNHELALVHGEGDFGRYKDAIGSYTLSSLHWVVSLIDEPYEGIDLSVSWRKIK